MILVTGAAGKSGRAVIEHLSGGDEPVRALVHKGEYEAVVIAAGAQEAVCGDLRDREVNRKAMDGVRAVYHIPPNVHPDELTIGKSLIQEARNAGVARFVYHSVLHPQVEAMPHHWQKMRVEEFLLKSGLNFTILQPAAYMQNILAQIDSVLNDGLFQIPYGIESKLSLVDLHDVALSAQLVLTNRGHEGATYEICGTSPLSQIQVADQLSKLLGRDVRADTISIERWAERAKEAGLGGYAIDALSRMFRYYDSYGFEGNPSVLQWLLGRVPHDLQHTLRRELDL